MGRFINRIHVTLMALRSRRPYDLTLVHEAEMHSSITTRLRVQGTHCFEPCVISSIRISELPTMRYLLPQYA